VTVCTGTCKVLVLIYIITSADLGVICETCGCYFNRI